MDIYAKVVTSIAVLVALICFAMLLRKAKLFEEKHGQIFSKLVTQVTLPSLIFVSLAKTKVQMAYCDLALVMLGAELACLVLAWVAAKFLKLSPPQTGAVVLVAGFGSSSLLGYPLIAQVFPGNARALTEAVVISELGVGPALFTLGTMIAMYFGGAAVAGKDRWRAAARFFVSPIFFSVVA